MVKPNSTSNILSISKLVAESDWGYYSESATVVLGNSPNKQEQTPKKVDKNASTQVYPSEEAVGYVT